MYQKLLLVTAAVLPALGPPAAADARPTPMTRIELADRVVNGLLTSDHPSTVALLDAASGRQFCTGTLIGCRTVLTAAHCVCDADGAACQGPGVALTRAADIQVFSQHDGFYAVDSVAVPPGYGFGVESDVAVLRLARPANGLSPTAINTSAKPALGSVGTIVGFGRSRGDRNDTGIKRQGRVETAGCTEVPGDPHLCWQLTSPLGAPGEDSSTCEGDSGGPLFLDFGDGPVVAGVTSGGANPACQPVDEAWDADVYFDRAWILGAGGDDLANDRCGTLPQAGAPTAPIFALDGSLDAATPQRVFSIDVPLGATRLRVALNSEEGPPAGPNDFDLFVRAAEPPTPSVFDCTSQLGAGYEFCEIEAPAAGAWYVLVDRFGGQGRFQVTATVFGTEVAGGGCVPDATTLCVDDQPGDRRFAVTVDFETSINGGSAGSGRAISLTPLGIRRGGLFWFFDITNPELLIKILNGCNVDGHYWVFWSAGTTVGLELRVTDTLTGRTVVYLDPDGTTAEPITDTGAFTCG